MSTAITGKDQSDHGRKGYDRSVVSWQAPISEHSYAEMEIFLVEWATEYREEIEDEKKKLTPPSPQTHK